MTQLTNPQPIFIDVTGALMDAGYLYVGEPNAVDARTAPILLYLDAALTIPAAQPLRTMGGVVVDNALSPVAVYFSQDTYSLRVEDANHVLVNARALVDNRTDLSGLSGPTGASLIGTQNGALQGILSTFQTKAPNKPYNAPESGLTQTLQGLSFHFYDPMAQAVRPTFGGGANLSGKVIPYTNTTDIAALWQRHSFTNVYFNQWLATKDDSYARRLSSDWNTAYALYPSPGMFTGGTGLYKGTGPSGSIVRTFDDACWLALYHMQADIVGAPGVSGQPAPIAYMVDTITAMLAKFISPATSSNPLVTLIDHAPNLTNIDYGLDSYTDPQTGMSRFTAPPVQTGTFGSLYARADDTANYPAYGQCSSAFEAHMAIAALYAFEKLGYSFMLQYAKRTQEFIRANLLTPDPTTTPADPTHTPSTPAARKARYLVETEFCIDATIPSNDPYPASMRPRFQWYGKPRANLDSTYLGGAFAFCVLSARLYRLTGTDSYRTDALNTAKAIISTQAYGRLVGGKTIIANTRDPHSEGHFAYLFATEVMSLPDAPQPVMQALLDSGTYIASNCVTSDGYLTGDWAGPESDGTYDTWEARYANNGTFAGAVQIMTSSETLVMLQAAVAVSDWASGGLPAPLSVGYDASQALVSVQGQERTLASILSEIYSNALGVKLALDNEGTLEQLQENVPQLLAGDGTPASSTDRQINIRWTNNAPIYAGGVVWTWIKTTLGKSDSQMATLLQNAEDYV